MKKNKHTHCGTCGKEIPFRTLWCKGCEPKGQEVNSIVGWKVYYSNQGKREATPTYTTKEEAEHVAKFLKFQGATKVMIRVKK